MNIHVFTPSLSSKSTNALSLTSIKISIFRAICKRSGKFNQLNHLVGMYTALLCGCFYITIFIRILSITYAVMCVYVLGYGLNCIKRGVSTHFILVSLCHAKVVSAGLYYENMQEKQLFTLWLCIWNECTGNAP